MAGPVQKRRFLLRSSIRAQAASVFLLLAILVPGLLGIMAFGLQATEQANAEQGTLQTWQLASARQDASSQLLMHLVRLWNEAEVANQLQSADQIHAQVADATSTIDSLDAEIGALNLSADATSVRVAQANAAMAVTTYAVTFTTTAHSANDQQAADALVRTAWAAALSQSDRYISAKILTTDATVKARTNFNYNLVILGIVLFVVGIGLLALLQFVSTLSPIARLAESANALAAGRQAAIPPTRRLDEIGQLTGALATWQESVGGALFRLRNEVAGSSTTLSVAAQDLASVTLEQTTAAAATSASMEILAQSSAAIADKIDRVAIQAGQTRSSLEQAQADLRASGDRTLALAGRVDEIGGILQRINDIADQTNLLALNAAIEAARAGDAGRGFAVVADEVRRLAENSKAASTDIARLVQNGQAQSSDTIMALEKGVKQMERALGMMQEMSELSAQVQMATQQQRSSIAEFVVAIESMAEGSRAVASTAQEIASAAASQGQLASDLAGLGWNRRDQGVARR